MNIQNIPVKRITPSSTNPRQSFDKKQMEDLQASIALHGVLSPIIVRPVAGDKIEIIAGERRWRACVALGLETIPAIERTDLTDEQVQEIQIIENLQRADVHPMEEAEGYARLLDSGKTEKTIAESVGKSVSYIYQRLQLTALTTPFRKTFAADKMTVTHAIHIARLDKDGQKKVWDRFFDRDSIPTVKALSDYINSSILLDLAKAPFMKDDATLYPKAGACAACPKRTGANKSLFEDIGKNDMCLDGDCFAKKRALLAERTLAEAADAGQPLLKITTRYSTETKGVLACDEYRIATEKEVKAGNVQQAIVTEGNDIGSLVLITTKKAVKDDGSTGLSEEERIKRAETRVANQKANIERLTRLEALKQVGAKVTKLASEDVKQMALTMFVGLSNHDRKVFIEEVLGKTKPNDFSATEQFKKLAPKNDADLIKFVVQMAFAPYVDSTETKVIADVTARNKVDVKKIKAKVEEENPIQVPKILQEQTAEQKKAA